MYSLKKVFDKREDGNLHHKNLRQIIHNKNRNINENYDSNPPNSNEEVKLTEAHIKRLKDLEIWRENRLKLKEFERKNKKKVFHNVVRSHKNKYESEFEYNSSEFNAPKGVRSMTDIKMNLNKTTTSFLYPKKINYLTHSSKKPMATARTIGSIESTQTPIEKKSANIPNNSLKKSNSSKKNITPLTINKNKIIQQSNNQTINLKKEDKTPISIVNKNKIQAPLINSTSNSEKDDKKILKSINNNKINDKQSITTSANKKTTSNQSKKPINGLSVNDKKVETSLHNSTMNNIKQAPDTSFIENKDNINESINQNNLMASPIQMITRSKLKILKEWAMTPEKSPFPKILERINSNQKTNAHLVLTPLDKKTELMKILQEWDED